MRSVGREAALEVAGAALQQLLAQAVRVARLRTRQVAQLERLRQAELRTAVGEGPRERPHGPRAVGHQLRSVAGQLRVPGVEQVNSRTACTHPGDEGVALSERATVRRT